MSERLLLSERVRRRLSEIAEMLEEIEEIETEIARLRDEAERLRMTRDDREVLRLVARQCAKRHWSDWAIVIDGFLDRHGGER